MNPARLSRNRSEKGRFFTTVSFSYEAQSHREDGRRIF